MIRRKRSKSVHDNQEFRTKMEKVQIELDDIRYKRHELKFLQRLLANDYLDELLLAELIAFQLAKVRKLFNQNDRIGFDLEQTEF